MPDGGQLPESPLMPTIKEMNCLMGTSKNSLFAAPGCEGASVLLPLVNIAHRAMLSSGRLAYAPSRTGSPKN